MPLPKRWHKSKKQKGAPPEGFDYVEPVLEALEHELRDKVKESNLQKRKTESMWPVHQINWQKSRYIYDLYYTYHRIDRSVYDYCIKNKLVDAELIAKWKKPGYERLCSTYVINSSNYKFGTTSICRVPLKDRSPEQQNAQDPTTGCRGCASGKDAGPKNIFGNKYGQNLAAVQIAREERQKKQAEAAAIAAANAPNHSDDDEEETDSSDGEDDDDSEGPSPAAGIWAGSQKVQGGDAVINSGAAAATSAGAGDSETDDDSDSEDEGPALPPAKKARQGEEA